MSGSGSESDASDIQSVSTSKGRGEERVQQSVLGFDVDKLDLQTYIIFEASVVDSSKDKVDPLLWKRGIRLADIIQNRLLLNQLLDHSLVGMENILKMGKYISKSSKSLPKYTHRRIILASLLHYLTQSKPEDRGFLLSLLSFSQLFQDRYALALHEKFFFSHLIDIQTQIYVYSHKQNNKKAQEYYYDTKYTNSNSTFKALLDKRFKEIKRFEEYKRKLSVKYPFYNFRESMIDLLVKQYINSVNKGPPILLDEFIEQINRELDDLPSEPLPERPEWNTSNDAAMGPGSFDALKALLTIYYESELEDMIKV